MLIAAHREEHAHYEAARTWLQETQETLDGTSAYGLSDYALSGFLRVVTNPRAIRSPSPPQAALSFVADLRSHPLCVEVRPGAHHWAIFIDLVTRTQARGNQVPDAYLAALAIESGCEWVTFDRGFARYPGLKWRSPLDPA